MAMVALAAAMFGCQDSAAGSHGGSAPSNLHVDSVANDRVEVPPPDVSVDSGVMTIAGTVQSRPGASGDLSGRVDISVLASNGNELQWLPALLTPDPIPAGGKSRYVIHYGWVPPSGSTIRVQWVDSATAKKEDAEGSDYASGGYGGAHTSHPTAVVHSNGGHSHHHMGW
jgi:hypothetical protein